MLVTGRFDAGGARAGGEANAGADDEGTTGAPRGEQCQSTSRRAQARTTTQEQTRAVERTKEPGEASGHCSIKLCPLKLPLSAIFRYISLHFALTAF